MIGDYSHTTKEDRRRWIMEGLRQGATHVIVVTDTFDYGDYVKPTESFAEVMAKYGNVNMQRVMETFDLTEDLVKRLQ